MVITIKDNGKGFSENAGLRRSRFTKFKKPGKNDQCRVDNQIANPEWEPGYNFNKTENNE